MADRAKEKVALAYPYGSFEPHFVQSLLHFFAYDHHHHARVVEGAAIALGTTNVAHGRNQIVRRFLDDTSCDWLWFIDTDMVFRPDTLEQLLAAADPKERPIVGALCFSVLRGDQREIIPTLYHFNDDGHFARAMDLPPDGLHRVAATGTGCLLIHRRVLEAIAAHKPTEDGPAWGETSWPWFKWSDWAGPDGPDVMGEDLTFCLRATACGFPIHVDTRIDVGHAKLRVEDRHTFAAQFGGAPARKRFVVVPMKDRRDLTESLLRQLAEQGECDRVFLFDNGSNRTTKNWLSTLPAEWRTTVVDAEGWGIHAMWNEGIRLALAQAPSCDIAILNNDLVLGDQFLSRLDAALRSDDRVLAACPNYDRRPATGIVPLQGISAGREDGTGGLSGFAFMVRGEMYGAGFPLFDEMFEWYAGDLDFVLTVDQFGGACVMATECDVVHVNGGSQTAGGEGKRIADPRLAAIADADNRRLEMKWGLTLVPAS